MLRNGTSVSSINFNSLVCTPRPLTSRPVMLPADSNLVDLIDVNDAELREVHVAVGLLHQFAHQVFDVAADVSCLAELRRVRFDEGHLDQISDVLDQVGFADPGGPDQYDVLLGCIRFLARDPRSSFPAGGGNSTWL